MPAESRREQILSAVQTRLAGIVAGPTFWFTPGEVGRDWKNYSEVTAFPFYGVIEGAESVGDAARADYRDVIQKLTVIVVGWVRSEENRRTVLNRAIQDVIVSVETDRTWGGLALETDPPTVITDEAALVAKPFAYFEIRLIITYLRTRGTV